MSEFPNNMIGSSQYQQKSYDQSSFCSPHPHQSGQAVHPMGFSSPNPAAASSMSGGQRGSWDMPMMHSPAMGVPQRASQQTAESAYPGGGGAQYRDQFSARQADPYSDPNQGRQSMPHAGVSQHAAPTQRKQQSARPSQQGFAPPSARQQQQQQQGAVPGRSSSSSAMHQAQPQQQPRPAQRQPSFSNQTAQQRQQQQQQPPQAQAPPQQRPAQQPAQLAGGGLSPYMPLKPKTTAKPESLQRDQVQRDQQAERKMVDVRRKGLAVLREFQTLQMREVERLKRERVVTRDVEDDAMEDENGMNGTVVPVYHTDSVKTKIKLRLKELEMLKLQRQVRAKVLQSLVEPQIPILINPEAYQVDLMKHPEATLKGMPRQAGNQNQQSLSLRLYQFKLKSFLEALEQHTNAFYQWHAQNKRKHREIAQMAERQVKEKERRIQQRKEKAEKDRLKALKEHDTEAYYNLLKEHKNDKILAVLNETDKYLRALGSAVKVQKKHLGAKPEPKKPGRKKKGQDEEAAEDDEGMAEDEFQRTDIKNTNEVDVKALMQNKAKYYELAHTESEEVTTQPDMLVGGQLRQYQMQGLKWLVSLYNNKLSGVLADEMGLGKTIQIVALIAYLMEVKHVRGPYLVVAPLSTIDNWVREFENWTPNVNKIIYNGDKNFRKKLQAEASKGIFNVLLTSYEYVMKDAGYLSRIQWEYIIVDEGHRMKNSASRLTTTLSVKFPSRYRILITGTPLQNNLNELWALLNFLLPDIFRHDSNFEQWFNTGHIMGATGDAVDMDEEEKLLLIDRLHQVLRPFLLRRLKSDVESELKAKVEKVVKCEMSACQWRLYEGIRDRGKVSLQPSTEANGGKPKGRVATNIMMELRKACNHPYLFWYHERPEMPGPEIFRSSGKFELLDRFLPKLRAVGHKVLIFCQMTKLMDIMGDFLTWSGHRYLRLDGSTDPQTRGELIEIFNAPESPFATFILSTRAGGLGLNLPAADTVIIYDSDWNPQMDMQAMDRAHRIGQTREVRVLRLTCVDTLEEDILARAINKKELGGAAIDAGMFNEKSTVEDRHEFLRKLIFKKTADMQNRSVLDSETMNREVARDDVEFEAFQAMDAELRLKRYHNGRTNNRLMENEEVPSWLQYTEEKIDPTKREKETRVEKASRKSRKRKTATYKEDNVSHSSDLDSTTDEEAALGKGAGKRKTPGRGKQPASPGSDDEGVDTGNVSPALAAAGSSKAAGASAAAQEPEEPTDHNKDYCEICADGGELICCDFCDCAYHPHCLGCAAEDLPDEYKCPRCLGTLDQILAEYNSKPRSSIYPGDFCNLCGDSTTPLLACKTCPRSFHQFCANAEPGTKQGSHWTCPECTCTTAQAFAWSRLVPVHEEREESEGIFREHAKFIAKEAADDDVAMADAPSKRGGREREREREPAPVAETPPEPKPRGRPRKSDVKKQGTPKGGDAEGAAEVATPDGAPAKRKRGRPPKSASKPQVSYDADEDPGGGGSDAEGGGSERRRSRGRREGEEKEAEDGEDEQEGSEEEAIAKSRSSKRKRRIDDDDE